MRILLPYPLIWFTKLYNIRSSSGVLDPNWNKYLQFKNELIKHTNIPIIKLY